MRCEVNKQLNDKERVAAALENPAIVQAVEQTLENAGRRGQSGDGISPGWHEVDEDEGRMYNSCMYSYYIFLRDMNYNLLDKIL